MEHHHLKALAWNDPARGYEGASVVFGSQKAKFRIGKFSEAPRHKVVGGSAFGSALQPGKEV